MAWNEPGKDDKDPWKNKGGKEQGPPDLDDLFKDIGNKLGGIFGGGKSPSSSSSSGNNFSGALIGIALVAALIVYGFSCIYTVKEADRGVKLRFGEYVGLVEPGLSWKWTFAEQVIPVDVQSTRNLSAEGSMLTQDENVVEVNMQVQYRVMNPRNYKFSVTDPYESLSEAFDSALRYVIGHSSMDDILTSGREQVRQDVRTVLEQIIEPYKLGLLIVDVNFKDARPPEAVKSAFDDAIAAQEDEIRYIRQAEAYARGIEPRARGRVQSIEQKALAYKEQVLLDAEGQVARFNKLLPEYKAAPEVTRQRLYITTMEKVYGNTSKVLVDVEGGNNVMYLPLDKMFEQSRTKSNAPKDSALSFDKTPEKISVTPSSVNNRSNSRSSRFDNGRN